MLVDWVGDLGVLAVVHLDFLIQLLGLLVVPLRRIVHG